MKCRSLIGISTNRYLQSDVLAEAISENMACEGCFDNNRTDDEKKMKGALGTVWSF